MKIESRRVDPDAARRPVAEKLDNGSAFSGFLARSLETGSQEGGIDTSDTLFPRGFMEDFREQHGPPPQPKTNKSPFPGAL